MRRQSATDHDDNDRKHNGTGGADARLNHDDDAFDQHTTRAVTRMTALRCLQRCSVLLETSQ
jgi:hypothetical protein